MESKQWLYNSPQFESDNYNLSMMRYSPWSGHRFFAYDYVANLHPHRIVELGSYYGCSAFSFLQAIKDYHLNSEFYGIDTWEGDSFTKTDYVEDVYGAYKLIQDKCFSEQKSRMMRMTFDTAVSSFDDESIDLLHIDGSHSYGDVKHDFMTWKSKVTKAGVILFHDISADKLYGETMGSHIFWNEIKQRYTFTLQFDFSYGLGILCFDKEVYQLLREIVNSGKYQQALYNQDVENKDQLRKQYFEVRELRKYIDDLKAQVTVCQEHLNKYSKDQSEKLLYIKELETENNKLSIKCRETFETMKSIAQKEDTERHDWETLVSQKESYIKELKSTIDAFCHTLSEKDEYIAQLQQTISDYERNVEGKDAYIKELEQNLTAINASLQQLSVELSDHQQAYDETIAGYVRTVDGKEAYIEELTGTISAYADTVNKKEAYIEELSKTVQKLNQALELKDKYIQQLLATKKEYEEMVAGKERYISELLVAINDYKDTVAGKDEYISELEAAIDGYKQMVSGKDDYINKLEYTDKVHRASISEKDDYIRNMIDSIRRYKEKIIENEKMIQNYLGDLETQKTEIERSNQVARNLQAENDSLRKVIESLENQKKKLEDQLEQVHHILSKSIWGKQILKKME